MFEALRETAARRPPAAALVLGSGLNSITDDWPLLIAVPFAELPGMPAATVAGHKGRLCLYEFMGNTVLVFQGRVHFYEGHGWSAVERPVRLAHELGVRLVVLTNASGGIGPSQDAGSLMAIRDHLPALHPNWWQPLALGEPAPPPPYSRRLLSVMQLAAADTGLTLPAGVYACMTGPSYETPAEVRALKAMGADAVGMSTVHEANTAAALGMEVAAVSCVANRAAGLSATPLSHREVLEMVASAAESMRRLLQSFLSRLLADERT